MLDPLCQVEIYSQNICYSFWMEGEMGVQFQKTLIDSRSWGISLPFYRPFYRHYERIGRKVKLN